MAQVYICNLYLQFPENLAVTGGRKGADASLGGEIPYARNQLGCGVCMNAGGTFYNCSITNNCYTTYYVYGGGVGMKDGLVDRCLMADNSITSAAGATYFGSGVYLTGGIVENSIITRNHTRYYGAVAINGANAVVRNCTIYGNDGLNTASAGLYFQNGTVQNCAVFNNVSTLDNDFGPSGAAASEKISYCASVNGFGTNAVVCADPIFTDPATFDFTFGAGSDLRNAGGAYDGAGDDTDYLGQPRVSGTAIDIGATEYQETAASCGISFSPKSELLVGESVILTATFAGIDDTNGLNCAWCLTNAFGHIVTTNGHEISLALPAGRYDIALEVTGAPDIEMSAFQPQLIRFVPPVMYADLLNESGAAYPWDGRANASTNIHELLDEAIDGCTIILVAGEYKATNTIEISRAVTLRGESGRDATFLRIAWNTRLLKLMNSGAVVEGITIRESRMDNTRNLTGSIFYMTEGIFRDSRLTCCTNTGCNTDGLLYASGGTVERMLIDRNKASNDYIHYHNHGTVYITGSSVMRNCVVADNINDNYGGVNLSGGKVENCTITGNLALFGGVGGLFVTYKNSRIINNIIYGNLSTPDNMATDPVPSDIACGDIQGVATTTMFFNNCATQASGTDCITDDPLLKGTGARPYQIPVKSFCVGVGLNDDWMATATDFYGSPRLSGHVVDIGAAEASPAATMIEIR